jgi:hypothetical protein
MWEYMHARYSLQYSHMLHLQSLYCPYVLRFVGLSHVRRYLVSLGRKGKLNLSSLEHC